MPRTICFAATGALVLLAAAMAPLSGALIPASASMACPVLYSGSRHTCYVYPGATVIKQAERQMPVRVVSPRATVRRFTSLRLTAVILDRTRRDTGVLHPWIIDYVFGHSPDLGLHSSTVAPSARFLVIGQSVGLIPPLNGTQRYNTPRFSRIRVNSQGRAIWTVSVNLPHLNATMTMFSTLPKPRLERLVAALMQQAV